MHNGRARWVLALMMAVCFCAVGRAGSAEVDVFWSGGSGSWTNTNPLNPIFTPVPDPHNGTPAGTTYHVTIDSGTPLSPAVVDLTSLRTIDTLTVGPGSTAGVANNRLQIGNDGALEVVGGAIHNAGEIVLNNTSSGPSSVLRIRSMDAVLSGGGVISMSNALRDVITGNDARLINEDNLIHGAGHISGALDNMRLTNRGTVRADLAGRTLTIHTTTVNSGLIESTSGGLLEFARSTAVTNFEGATPGVIRADGGKVVVGRFNTVITGGIFEVTGGSELEIGGTVTGAVVNNSGTGLIRLNGGTVTGGVVNNSSTGLIRLDGTLGGTVNNPAGGVILVPSSRSGRLEGVTDLNNAGDLRVEGGGSFGPSNLILKGGGTLTLAGPNAHVGLSGFSTLINQDHTIRGTGTFSLNLGRLINDAGGMIHANEPGEIVVAQSSIVGGGSFENLGTVRIENGSRLRLAGFVIPQIGYSVPFNFLNLSGSTITGGTFDIAGQLQHNAVIHNNAAHIILDGPSAVIRDHPGNDVLRNFRHNMAAGHFTIKNGRDFTTAAALATFINDGVLEIGDGSTFSHAGSGGLAHSGIITGSGVLDTIVHAAAGSVLAPGSSPGTLTMTGYITQGDTHLEWELGSTVDKVVVTDVLDFNNHAVTVHLIDAGGIPDPQVAYPLFELLNGTIDNLDLSSWTLDYSAAPQWTGGVLAQVDNQIVITSLQVPEPASLISLAIGSALSVAWLGWRRACQRCSRG